MAGDLRSRMWFGAFEFDARALELRRDGRVLPLQPQPGAVLGVLLARAGDLVTREELRDAIWGTETFVDFDRGLNFAIRQIRAVLEDDPDSPTYVETLRGRGYRFIAPVRTGQAADRLADGGGQTAADEPTGAPTHYRPLAAVLGVLAVLAVGVLSWGRPGPPPDPLVNAIGVATVVDVDGSGGAAAFESEVIAALSESPLGVVRITEGGPRPVWRVDVTTGAGDPGVRVTATLVDQRNQAVRWARAFDMSDESAATDRRSAARLIAMAVRFSIEGPSAIPAGNVRTRRPRPSS